MKNLIHTVIAIFVFGCSILTSQNYYQSNSYSVPVLNRKLKDSENLHPVKSDKKGFTYSGTNWDEVIDEYWGAGLPTDQKLALFEQAVDVLNRRYAAFQNLEINFDSLVAYYRTMIQNGLSRGKFAAVMNHLALAFTESHTIIADIPVNFGTQLAMGVPLFVVGPWQDNSWFGASLTPMPDSSLLVYRALPNHKLGIVAGDIILGYNGVPWKVLYKELLKAKLPILPIGTWASSKTSSSHCFLASAGLNWHLFDTIDIVKHSNADTLHLPTHLLEHQTGFIWGNEQIPIDGVPFPNFSTDDFVYWGVIPSLNIGYVYVTSWSPDESYQISTQFYNAIDSLMNHYSTDGLILDFRNNNGGWMGTAHAGYSLLFKDQVFSVAFDIRAGDLNHFHMIPHPHYTKERFLIPGDSSTFYDKPIAVLTGPGSISNGDFESWRMRLHPRARLFGKPSCGAFATSSQPSLNNSDWFFYLTYGNSYPVNEPGNYLTHTDLVIDEEVWLTQEGVISGNDDVVEKALNWIFQSMDIQNDPYVEKTFQLFQNYPNPFNLNTKIPFRLDKGGFVDLSVFTVCGKLIRTLTSTYHSEGLHTYDLHATDLVSGVYFIRLSFNNEATIVSKMVLLK